jgi:hypothetical protein
MSPVSISLLLSRFKKITPPNNYDSYFGESTGWNAPNSGRHIWSRWFPSDQSYVGRSKICQQAVHEIRATIAGIEFAMRSPFINKAQGHCVRILPLLEVLPNLVLVRIYRNKFYTAQSILLGRRSFFKNDKHWFSAKPSNYDKIKNHPPIQQICEQIHYLEADIDQDIKQLAIKSVFNIGYEYFCTNPQKVVKDFAKFYRRQTGVELKNRRKPPVQFKVSNSIKVNKRDLNLIKFYITEL